MNKEEDKNTGCLKLFLYFGAGIIILLLLDSVFKTIGYILNVIPWYVYLILFILFIIIKHNLKSASKE